MACVGTRSGAYRVLWGNLSERDHPEDLGTDGRIILKCFLKKWMEKGLDCSDLDQDREKWRAFVTTIIN